MSWCWNRDLSLFWPKDWLPFEPALKDARITTFGYNAHFMSQSGDVFNISDFAKDLLSQLKFGTDETGTALDMGKVIRRIRVFLQQRAKPLTGSL